MEGVSAPSTLKIEYKQYESASIATDYFQIGNCAVAIAFFYL